MSKRHKEALSHMIYGVQQRKGILSITGEIGTGKTTLCRVLLNSLDKEIKSAFILNPNFSSLELLHIIVEDFGISPSTKSKVSLVSDLNNFLIKESQKNHNVLLIIDESQNLDPSQLEQIRLLTNLETAKEKLLQIILVGQPELKEKLELPNLKQLNQRIAVKYHILPLEKDEMGDYINHRLNIAGSNGELKFTNEAMEEIYNYSKGIPRMINIVCDRALLAAFVEETREIGKSIIEKASQELK
ncbi:MAG TPA: AAA family ATPase [Candidatus Omnitrophota bacterium]|nr:AAA family ATPase [Candidatus Omnitrophota bacterium]